MQIIFGFYDVAASTVQPFLRNASKPFSESFQGINR